MVDWFLHKGIGSSLSYYSTNSMGWGSSHGYIAISRVFSHNKSDWNYNSALKFFMPSSYPLHHNVHPTPQYLEKFVLLVYLLFIKGVFSA